MIHKKVGKFLVITLILTGLFAFGLIYEYNRSVNLKFEIGLVQNRIEELGLSNSERKIQLYETLAPEKLEVARRELGLVKENSPHYFTGNSDMVAYSNQ